MSKTLYESVLPCALEAREIAHPLELSVLDGTGDTKIIWDKDRPDEIENARETFERLRAKGYAAWSVKGDGDKGEQVKKFDPKAQKLIFVPPMQSKLNQTRNSESSNVASFLSFRASQ